MSDGSMNGAQAAIRTLVGAGVDTCFTNPGTSEMHFVAALDDVAEMRAVLALFEGVATGAADGYARMTGRPAATLLHLGPGLGNGLANLHNARRAHTPVVNIVGDHATHHARYDAPLQSDIHAVASNVSSWVRSSASAADVGADTAQAVAASMGPPGQVATLVLPADTCWTDGATPASALPGRAGTPVDDASLAVVAKALTSGEPAAILVGGRVCAGDGLSVASGIAVATGAKLLGEVFPARLERGAGRAPLERIAYLAEFAEMQLDGLRHLVVVDTSSPASFFAYPGKASDLVPDGCEVHVLADASADALAALDALADRVGGRSSGAVQELRRPERPTGELTGETVAHALGALMPEGAIVADEANTAGLWASGATAGCPPHSWLTLTGGAIGFGMPVATGAAVACPDRPVINLEADGSAMYTLQALWTQAREGLDVTTIILNNRSYAVLNLELARVGATDPGPKALSMLDLSTPPIDFVAMASGMGVPATRATTAEEVTTQLERALAEPGPHLIDAVIPSSL